MPFINKGSKKKRQYRTDGNKAISAKCYNAYRKLRQAYIMQHPLCEKCAEKGIVKPAEQVHHIKPILSGDSELESLALATDPKNLIALCEDCHTRLHIEMRKGQT